MGWGYRGFLPAGVRIQQCRRLTHGRATWSSLPRRRCHRGRRCTWPSCGVVARKPEPPSELHPRSAGIAQPRPELQPPAVAAGVTDVHPVFGHRREDRLLPLRRRKRGDLGAVSCRDRDAGPAPAARCSKSPTRSTSFRCSTPSPARPIAAGALDDHEQRVVDLTASSSCGRITPAEVANPAAVAAEPRPVEPRLRSGPPP